MQAMKMSAKPRLARSVTRVVGQLAERRPLAAGTERSQQ